MPTEKPKRKAPVERKPLGNITNFKGDCPSHLNPKKKKPAKNSKIELEYQIPQEELTPSLTEDIAVVELEYQTPQEELTPSLTEDIAVVEPEYQIPQEELTPSLTEDIAVVTSDIQNQSIPIEPTTTTPHIEREPILQSDIQQIKLPEPSWHREQLPGDSACVNYFQVLVQKCSVAIQKIATVDYQKMTIQQTIISRELTEIEESRRSFTTLHEVEEMLTKLNEAKICPGILNNTEKHRQDGKTFVNNGKFTDGVWRANKYNEIYLSTI